MQNSTVEKIMVSDEFDNLDFGNPTTTAGYGKNNEVKSVAAASTSATSFICGVIKQCIAVKHDFKSSHPFLVAFDDAARVIYIRAEVRFQDLDKGTDITDESMRQVKFYAKPGDKMQDYVPKKLGGLGSVGNYFPLNSDASFFNFTESLLLHSFQANTKEWEISLNKIYDHVKQGEEKSARIMYAMIHPYRNEYSIGNRPSHIFYIFNLYTNGKFTGERIEGKVYNPIAYYNPMTAYDTIVAPLNM